MFERESTLADMDILTKLMEGLEKHEMPHTVSENTDNSPTIIRFEKANEHDCALSVTISGDKLEMHRVIGAAKITQSFDLEQIDVSFFEMLRDHHDTIISLIKMRDKLTKGR
jgi:hypothetical protein